MHSGFLVDLSLVMAVATFVSVIAHKLRFSLILSYLFAGLLVGPYIPIPFFADHHRIEQVADFGVIFVMFFIGLEFKLKSLLQAIPLRGFVALVQILMLMFLGFGLGRLLGWSFLESIFLGASISISSTMVVSGIFSSRYVPTETKEHVYGILILQDLVAIVLISLLTLVSRGVEVSVDQIGWQLGQLIFFLIVLLFVGLLFVPRFIRYVFTFNSKETNVIATTGVCLGFATLASYAGYSTALGAFLAGVLIAESGLGKQVEKELIAMRNFFAPIFFVSIGMTVDPIMAYESIGSSFLVAGVVVIGMFFSIASSSLLLGISFNTSLRSALNLGQIGEFAFIISAVGISAGIIKAPLQVVLVSVSILTIFSSTFLSFHAVSIVNFIDKSVPKRVRVFLTLYESWLDSIRKPSALNENNNSDKEKGKLIKVQWVLFIDFSVIVFFAIVIDFFKVDIVQNFHSIGLSFLPDNVILVLLFMMLSSFVYWGFIKNLFYLENMIIDLIKTKTGDEGGAFIIRFLISSFMISFAVMPFLFLIAGMLHPSLWFILLPINLFIIGFFLWKYTAEFDVCIKSGSGELIELFEKRFLNTSEKKEPSDRFVGLNKLTYVRVNEKSTISGKSLTEINLRAKTGATVVSIVREGAELILPTGSEILRIGDVMCLAGTDVATEQAMRLLK